jgi:hypothetical protein
VYLKKWLEVHKALCVVDYGGTSGGMEVCGAVSMFSHPIENDLCYAEHKGGGDNRTYKVVLNQQSYGPDTERE